MKHGKTRCDKNWKWTESGETLGIIETQGSSSYLSDHIYKHLQALPFLPPHNGFSHFTPGFSSHEHLPAENVFHGAWSRSVEVVRMRWEATGLFEKISFMKNQENLHSRKLPPGDPKILWFGKGISFQQFGNVWCPAVCFRGCMAKKNDI